MEMQSQTHYIHVERTIEILLNALRLLQEELGSGQYTDEDCAVLDTLERLVSKWRDRETALLGNPFGSVFRARYQPSLFAHSLRRYCDLYMSSVSSLRNYSPQHRFYPEDSRLLSHEICSESDCWALEDVMLASETLEMADTVKTDGGDISEQEIEEEIERVMIPSVNSDTGEEEDGDVTKSAVKMEDDASVTDGGDVVEEEIEGKIVTVNGDTGEEEDGDIDGDSAEAAEI